MKTKSDFLHSQQSCLLYLLMAWLASSLLATAFAEDPLDVWHVRSQRPGGGAAGGVAFAENQFVVVADGANLVSSDGAQWNRTLGERPGSSALFGLTYGHGLYFRYGFNNPLSTNGSDWFTTYDPALIMDRRAITYGDGRFVTVGIGGSLTTSTNGVLWCEHYSGTTNTFYGITHGNGLFVAVDVHGGVLTSTDAVHWSHQIVTTNRLVGVGYGNGLFVAVGAAGAIVTSPNGVDWTERAAVTTRTLCRVAYGNGVFVAAGSDYLNSQALVTSTDGVSWTDVTSTVGGVAGYGVAFGNGIFVTGGNAGLWTSPEGRNWNQGSYVSALARRANSIAYGAGRFVAVGWNGSIITSTNGIDWSSSGTSDNHTVDTVYDVAYGNGIFVTVSGLGAEIHTSTNGSTWDRRTLSGDDYPAGRRIFHNGLFMGALPSRGSHHGVAVSPDPLKFGFSRNALPGAAAPLAVAGGDGQFICVGKAGAVWTSTNAVDWMIRNVGTAQDLRRVAYGNGRAVALGSSGSTFTSGDLLNWTTSTPLGYRADIAFANGTFVAVGPGGRIVTSTDGMVWRTRSSGVTNHLRDVAYGHGTFVVVGDDETILQSGSFSTPWLSGRLNSALNAFEVTAFGEAGTSWRLQTCTDLRTRLWTDITAFTFASSSRTVFDAIPDDGLPRFYRLVSP